MTTVRTIIKDAYRESNLIPESQDPTAGQSAEGLRMLNRFIKSIVSYELGDPLYTVNVGDNNVQEPYYDGREGLFEGRVDDLFVPRNCRLLLNLTTPKEINLHPKPRDGMLFAVTDVSDNLATNTLTVNGNGRTIENANSLVLDTNGQETTWFYRNDTGNWHKITDLDYSDVFPFPEGFDDFFIISLAMRLNPRNGAVVDQQSGGYYTRMRNQFRSKYRQEQEIDVEEGLLRLGSSRQSRYHISESRLFDRGFTT